MTYVGKTQMSVDTYHIDDLFVSTLRFFALLEAKGYCSRIALQYGNGATGADYSDGTNPIGENAFAVYRFNGATSGNPDSRRDGVDLPDFDFYILVQWARLAAFGDSPGNPGLVDNTTGDAIGLQVALREDGTSPWGGSTNNDGTDLKSDPVWTPGTSTVHVFPVSNAYTGGSHTASKQNCVYLYQGSSAGTLTLVGGPDGIVWHHDPGSSMLGFFGYVGIYEPLTGLNPSIPIVCMCSTDSDFNTVTLWGTLTGTGPEEGGVLGTNLANLMSPMYVKHSYENWKGQYDSPNTVYADGPRLVTRLIHICQDTGAAPLGEVGVVDPYFLRLVYGGPFAACSGDGKWASLPVGPALHTSRHPIVRWDGGLVASNTLGREGREWEVE